MPPTEGLSYPALKCVIQKLEGNKRIQISSRCPSLRKVEKSIPLYLKTMWFDQTDYHINDKRYEIKEFVRLLNETPSSGDILSGSPLKYEKRILKFLIGKEYVEELPDDVKLHEARKRLVCALLGGRPTIHVQKLDIDFFFIKVLRIPEGVKFKTTEVSVSGSIEDLRLFLPIIHPESFPLKVLRVWVTDPSMLDLPEVHSAQELEIHFEGDSNYNKLHNLPNRTIRVVDYDMPQEAIIGLIDNWVDFGKDVGSTFTTECGPLNHLVSDVLKEAEEMFGGRKVELVEKDERCYTSIIAIPMPFCSSELIVYGYRIDYYHIKMAVIPQGLTIPIENPSSEVVLEESVEESSEEESYETDDFEIPNNGCLQSLFSCFGL